MLKDLLTLQLSTTNELADVIRRIAGDISGFL
jgi:hypothetical protein